MRIALLATALLLAPPLARACDTEYLNSQLTLVCRAALDPALALLRGLAPQATAPRPPPSPTPPPSPRPPARPATRSWVPRRRSASPASPAASRPGFPEPPAIWPMRQAAR